MYLSKVTLVRSADTARELLDLKTTGVYATHQIIWQLFKGASKGRDFIYREDMHASGLPEFFVLSQLAPENDNPIFSVQSKPFSPQLSTGDRLAFRLRVNPTITIKETSGKSRRHDVLMHAKRQAKERGEKNAESIKSLANQAAKAWIADEKRLEKWGVSMDFVPEVERYAQHQGKKNSKENIRFSSVDYQGILTVNSPEVFLARLYQGFGHAKGFGCGLMLIKRC